MSDLINREDAIEILSERAESLRGMQGDLGGACRGAMRIIESLPSAEPERKWIPFTVRKATEDELEVWPEFEWVFDCPLPNDGDTVLLTNGKNVWEDTFRNDDGCYFDKADDIEDYDGYAWMPMPEPYRGEK